MDILENMRKMLEAGKISKEDIERAFPELKESEDERIRKAALEGIEYLERKLGWDAIGDTDILDVKEYLEKQKEQKPFNDTQEYLKGVARVQDYDELTKFEKVFDRIADTYAHRKNKDGYNEPWYTKKRAAEMLYHAKEELGLRLEQNPAEWSEEDRNVLNAILLHLNTPFHDMDEMEMVWFNWLRSLPERFNLQSKQEWSEEDEKHREWINEFLLDGERKIPEFAEEYQAARNWFNNKLKSIRPQPHWKPSEEQMEVLQNEIKCCYACGTHERAKQLETIYDDLKKL